VMRWDRCPPCRVDRTPRTAGRDSCMPAGCVPAVAICVLSLRHRLHRPVNVSFPNLRMRADPGCSDRVCGLGVGIFYVSYILLEIPGAIIGERWSARKWVARIMISWGAVAVLTGFVQNTSQCYAARFLLGAAEASFVPAMLVYLTRAGFCCRTEAGLLHAYFAALPVAAGAVAVSSLAGHFQQALRGTSSTRA
jgi:MFS transporter